MQGIKRKNTRNIRKLFRSPTLETIKMVEKVIENNSGEFKKTQIWEMLPRKVMWPTYLTVLEFLEEINKIVISDEGIITYIWNPLLVKELRFRKTY
jgi:hypothetical protein